VLLFDVSPVLGVSILYDLALLGVDLVIVGRRPRIVRGGTVVSAGVIDSAQGLFEGSSTAILFPLLLSLLLSLILFGSPLIAWCLVNPEELDPELESG
jgi:hypothetical protein